MSCQEQTKEPGQRGVYHRLLLGQSSSGRTYAAQKVIFPIGLFFWPPEDGRKTLRAVAPTRLQAEIVSTASVTATTTHAAACMNEQELTNDNMIAGIKERKLVRKRRSCRVLIMDEITMASASLFSMLNFRSTLGRRKSHHLSSDEYHKTGNAFGRIPIALYLGDLLVSCPTTELSLATDLGDKNKHGHFVHNDVSLEAAQATKVFDEAPDVFELRESTRCTPGDPLLEFLDCTRAGWPFPRELWSAFQARWVPEMPPGFPDPRLANECYRSDYTVALQWVTLTRLMNLASRRLLRHCSVQMSLPQWMRLRREGSEFAQSLPNGLHARLVSLSHRNGDPSFDAVER